MYSIHYTYWSTERSCIFIVALCVVWNTCFVVMGKNYTGAKKKKQQHNKSGLIGMIRYIVAPPCIFIIMKHRHIFVFFSSRRYINKKWLPRGCADKVRVYCDALAAGPKGSRSMSVYGWKKKIKKTYARLVSIPPNSCRKTDETAIIMNDFASHNFVVFTVLALKIEYVNHI